MKIRMKPLKARELIKEIEAHLPLPVHLTPEAAYSLRQQGKNVRADETLQVTSVMDSDELGGILCGIKSEGGNIVIALTHVRIGADHPLKARVEAYQRARVRKLSRQRW
jgi:hypothetical protein